MAGIRWWQWHKQEWVRCTTLAFKCFLPCDTNIFVYLSFLGVSIAVVTHHDQKQLGKRKVYFLLQVSSHNPSLGKVKAELSQELKRGSWRDTANWLAPLRANRTTNPGMALPRLSYTLSYQSSSKT